MSEKDKRITELEAKRNAYAHRIQEVETAMFKLKDKIIELEGKKYDLHSERNLAREYLTIAETERDKLRESLVDNWDHSWKCKEKLGRHNSDAPPILLEECMCGLADELRQARKDE